MSQNQTNNSIWVIIIAVFVVSSIVSVFSSGPSATTSSSSSPVMPGTVERRYVETRFRQEGYNAADSAKAADAVLKFHQAQQNRR